MRKLKKLIKRNKNVFNLIDVKFKKAFKKLPKYQIIYVKKCFRIGHKYV